MTVNSLVPVRAPTKTPLAYGLMSVADVRPEPTRGGYIDPHWRNGVFWQNVCPDGNATYDSCISALSLGVSGLPAPASKATTAARSSWGATPFTVFVEVDCSPPGFWDEVDEIVDRVFTESASFEIETAFYTGTVSGQQVVYPHLVSNTGRVNDAGITLQLIAGNVGPTGAPLDPVEALARLESALSTCVKGVGVIHMPTGLIAHFLSQHVIEESNGGYVSPAGHRIVVSSAYTGVAPDGTTTANALWMYGTGPVFLYHSRGKFLGDRIDSLNRSINTEKRIFERTYVIGYDCCLFGVAVSIGGIVAGTPGVAT